MSGGLPSLNGRRTRGSSEALVRARRVRRTGAPIGQILSPSPELSSECCNGWAAYLLDDMSPSPCSLRLVHGAARSGSHDSHRVVLRAPHNPSSHRGPVARADPAKESRAKATRARNRGPPRGDRPPAFPLPLLLRLVPLPRGPVRRRLGFGGLLRIGLGQFLPSLAHLGFLPMHRECF